MAGFLGPGFNSRRLHHVFVLGLQAPRYFRVNHKARSEALPSIQQAGMKVNAKILTWARTTAGLSPQQAAHALGFNDTRQRTATECLEALETGEEELSRSVLLKMAKAYRRSLLVFYLKEPPRAGDRGQDFRSVQGAESALYDPLLDALIRDVRARQAIVRDVAQDTETKPLEFVGTASMDRPPLDLARRISERLQFSLDEFRAQPTPEMAFNYLRRTIEDAGIYVLLLGNLGSYHTKIPVEVFRGFAIADPIAPFIVLNDGDARTAWSFTALHEAAHIWLGATGVSGESLDAQIEKYCNDVAGEVLLPAGDLRTLQGVRAMPLAEAVEAIAAFAKLRKVSRAMVAYRLLRVNGISVGTWRQLAAHFREEWITSRERDMTEKPEGGPSYYVLRRHRLGNALVDFVRRTLAEGAISRTKAGQVLGVKPRSVDPLIHGISAPENR
ncbi:MAG: ImmA/IrrE family metallo-endopeptidase [Acidobacteriaceae bacterium]|nr:ImmA/IrrE family metallo-endopeptidase [Acidobacteriaceae bacterium]